MASATLPKVGMFSEDGAVAAPADSLIRTPGSVNDRRMVRRRGNMEQGKALEFLGHSVEYLVDSRLFTKDEAEAQNDREAVQILMRCSRAVFAECPEVTTIQRRLVRWYWSAVRSSVGYDRRS